MSNNHFIYPPAVLSDFPKGQDKFQDSTICFKNNHIIPHQKSSAASGQVILRISYNNATTDGYSASTLTCSKKNKSLPVYTKRTSSQLQPCKIINKDIYRRCQLLHYLTICLNFKCSEILKMHCFSFSPFKYITPEIQAGELHRVSENLNP